jgi:hypothetical protein
LDNLTIIIDCNGYGSSEDRKLDQKKLLSKLYAFGLRCKVIDGHNYGELVVMNPFADPGCILLDTVKGKGVPLWEKNHVHLVYGDMLKMGIKEWRDINRVS